VKATVNTKVVLSGSELKDLGIGLEGREGASIVMTGGTLQATKAIHAGKDEMRYGPVTVELKDVDAANAESTSKCGTGSSIVVNGKKLSATKAAKGT